MKTGTIVLFVGLLSVATDSAIAHDAPAKNAKPAPHARQQQEWGIAGDAKRAKRQIAITMADAMRFAPDKIEIRQGETIKFRIRNDGKMLHEMVIGSTKALEEHAALMVKFPSMQHSAPYMTHVPPGKTGEIVWTFNRAGEFEFACLIPGHYQAGMKGRITVIGK